MDVNFQSNIALKKFIFVNDRDFYIFKFDERVTVYFS